MGSGLENKEDEGESVGAMGLHRGGGGVYEGDEPCRPDQCMWELRQESTLAVLQTGIA